MHDIYRVCFDEDFVGVVLLAMTEKYKTIIKLTSSLHCKPAKSIINNSRSDWFSNPMGETMRSVQRRNEALPTMHCN